MWRCRPADRCLAVLQLPRAGSAPFAAAAPTTCTCATPSRPYTTGSPRGPKRGPQRGSARGPKSNEPAEVPRARVPHVLPTAVALRQMAGIDTRRPEPTDETEEQRAARLKRESDVAKAASIEASRLARERLEVRTTLPQDVIPPNTLPTPRTPPVAPPAKPLVSPFKKFDPFFDYAGALEEAAQMNPPANAAPTTAKRGLHGAAANTKATGSRPSNNNTTSSGAPSPVPPPATPSAADVATKVSVSSLSSQWKAPFTPLRPRLLRTSKVLAAREEVMTQARESLEDIEKSAIDAARRQMNGEPEPAPAPQPAVDPAAARKPRGPASATASIQANKHSVNSLNLAKEATSDDEQPSKKKKKKSKKSQSAAEPTAPTPGPDGKMPLQSASTFVKPKMAPWHPSLFMKQFVMKIHPDLYHRGHGDEEQEVLVGRVERPEKVTSDKIIITNQDAVSAINGIIDYYKQVKDLPSHNIRVPSVPMLPPHPQALSFYCRVVSEPPEAPGVPPLTAEQRAALPVHIKLFEGEWSLTAYDLSSLARLIAQIEGFFVRLALTTQVDVDPTVRKRWEVLARQRRLEKTMWESGETAAHKLSGGYLKKDPTADSYSQSPGRYRTQYMSFYAQTPSSHDAISRASGFKSQQLYNPLDPTAAKLPPLLEQMMRSGLLRFDSDIDMLQRVKCLQTFIQVMTGYDLSHLYVHLWLGVRILIMPPSYEYDELDHNYRYSADEWQMPWNFEREKFVTLVRQYLHAYHGDNPQGLTLIDAIAAK